MLPIENFCPDNQPIVRLKLGHFNLCKDSKIKALLSHIFSESFWEIYIQNQGQNDKKRRQDPRRKKAEHLPYKVPE